MSAFHSPATAQDLGGALDLGQLGASIGVNNAIRAHVAQSKNGPLTDLFKTLPVADWQVLLALDPG